MDRYRLVQNILPVGTEFTTAAPDQVHFKEPHVAVVLPVTPTENIHVFVSRKAVENNPEIFEKIFDAPVEPAASEFEPIDPSKDHNHKEEEQ